MSNNTIAILGCGNMGSSLIGGLISQAYPQDKLWVSDPDEQKLLAIKKQYGIHTTQDNQAAVSAADIVIIAVKPQVIAAILSDLQAIIQKQKPLILSIAAGITEATLQTLLGGNIAIIRSMPNTPSLIGCGATALFANTYVSATQKHDAENILRAVGITVWLQDEKLMDIVTALSGSGPAYFFLIIEILQKAAEEHGLPKELARMLTLQTAYGATRMALESDSSAIELRQRVTSPGGTTEHALKVLEEKNLRQIFTDAISAAKTRSETLNHPKGT